MEDITIVTEERKRSAWSKFWNWLDRTFNRRHTINSVISEEDRIDQEEIESAERAIVNHQYLKHMAEARIAARAEWKRLQGDAHGNVRPLPQLDDARKKRQA